MVEPGSKSITFQPPISFVLQESVPLVLSLVYKIRSKPDFLPKQIQ